MKNSKIITAVVAVLVVILGYIFASPYITVNQIKAAVKSSDAEALAERVDFPVLRQNLKDQLNASIMTNMSKEIDEDNQFAAFGAALGGMMAERMIDALVTPAGIARMMQNRQFGQEGAAEGSSAGQVEGEPFADAVMSYESFNRFVIILPGSESEQEVKYVLSRKGIGWKLSDMVLPL